MSGMKRMNTGRHTPIDNTVENADSWRAKYLGFFPLERD